VSRRVLILRPEPGASATARRAAELGMEPLVAPLFEIVSLPSPPLAAAAYDAVLLTSANAARHGGASLLSLPCYAVGEATAAAARDAGYRDIHTGPADGAAAAAAMAADGVRRALHPCGRDHVPVTAAGVAIERRIVYAAEPATSLPFAARTAIDEGALVLIHSPRAARIFAALVADRERIRIAAISAAAADAAGAGWAGKAVAARPRDEALLELAAQLCQTGPDDAGDG
jgi:uroporphyrinogen-III synthase